MKKRSSFFLVLVAAILIFNACDKGNNDDIEIAPFIYKNYLHTAKELSLVENGIGPYDTFRRAPNNTPYLDYEKVEDILKILSAVYYLHSPQTDTIFNIIEFKSPYCMFLNRMLLYAYESNHPNSENEAWEKLINGNLNTGYKELDDLIEKYDVVSASKYPTYENRFNIYVNTKDDLNMFVVSQEFAELENIARGRMSGGCITFWIEDYQIYLNIKAESAKITFWAYGYGNDHKYWEFKVEHGKAELTRIY